MENDATFINSSFSFWKRLIFIAIFFFITPIAIGTSMVSLLSLNSEDTNSINQIHTVSSNSSGAQVFASLPKELPSVSGQVLGVDARGEMIKQYMQSYNSPMEPYAEFMVKMADKYGLDYRLTTAIARKESALGKHMPSPDCHNAWGWGIHSAGTLCFDTWEEGIEAVSKGLKENYINNGLTTPEEIMSRYTPQSPEGIWAINVSDFIDEMQ